MNGCSEKQIDIITDLLIEFDEMCFGPTTACPDPEAYAVEWRDKLTSALKGYRKQNTELEKVIQMLDIEYERAKNMEYVKKPLAWALHQVWKKIDAEKGGEQE